MDETAIRAMQGLVEDWRTLTDISGLEPCRIDGWLVAATGGPGPMHNQASLIEPCRDPRTAVRNVTAVYDERALPFLLQIPSGLDAASEREIASAGFTQTAELPLMLTSLDGHRAPASGVSVNRATNEEDLARVVRVAAEGFGISEEFARPFVPAGVLGHGSVGVYLAAIDGDPAGCGQVVVNGHGAGLYSIATVPRARKRGVARAVTIALLTFARQLGADLAYLQSSDVAMPLYEQLGFRTVAHHRLYARG